MTSDSEGLTTRGNFQIPRGRKFRTNCPTLENRLTSFWVVMPKRYTNDNRTTREKLGLVLCQSGEPKVAVCHLKRTQVQTNAQMFLSDKEKPCFIACVFLWLCKVETTLTLKLAIDVHNEEAFAGQQMQVDKHHQQLFTHNLLCLGRKITNCWRQTLFDNAHEWFRQSMMSWEHCLDDVPIQCREWRCVFNGPVEGCDISFQCPYLVPT